MNAMASVQRLLAAVCFAYFLPSAALAASAPAGDQMTAKIGFTYAVYYLPKAAGDPLAVLRKQAAALSPELKLVDKFPASPAGPMLAAHIEDDVKNVFRAPSLAMLKFSGRGLSDAQAQAVQQSEQALVLSFGHPKKDVWRALRMASELVENTARATDGLVWDEETRELFTPDAWHERRLAGWTGQVPDLSSQITIHSYKNGEYVRAISLGMLKAGLPDIVVEELPWSASRQVGTLIKLFGQALAEGARLPANGQFDLNLHAIAHAGVRNAQLAALKKGATGLARLALKTGKADEGDPDNRIIELGASRYAGPDMHAKQEAMLSSLFGSEDSIRYIRHDAALQEASRQARSHLPALQKAFNAGLRPGEYIIVKAPFATPKGGREWMWVEIAGWQQGVIKGSLQNDPFEIPTLHAGQIVEVREDDVFDYVRRLPGGQEEGGETSKIIAKMREQR